MSYGNPQSYGGLQNNRPQVYPSTGVYYPGNNNYYPGNNSGYYYPGNNNYYQPPLQVLPNNSNLPGCLPVQTWVSGSPIYSCPPGASNRQQCVLTNPSGVANNFICP